MDMTGSVAAAAHSHAQSMAVECDGSVDPSRKGSWKGHILPGALFVVWGSWWALNVIHRSLAAQGAPGSRGTPFRSRAFYAIRPSGALHWIEPALKVLGPLVAVSTELYLDHHGHYRYLYCPEGSKFAGRFALTHMNNWQHASSYPGFVLSGLVDLLGAKVPFPAGTSRGLLAYAFASMAFLMGLHEKHDAMDKAVHWLLFFAMATAAAAVVAEAARPRSAIASAARAAAAVHLGAWFIQVGRIEFEGHPQWSEEYVGGAMLAPVFYVFCATAVVACFVVAYSVAAALNATGRLPAPVVGGEEDDQDADLDGGILPRHRLDGPARWGLASGRPRAGDQESRPLLAGGAQAPGRGSDDRGSLDRFAHPTKGGAISPADAASRRDASSESDRSDTPARGPTRVAVGGAAAGAAAAAGKHFRSDSGHASAFSSPAWSPLSSPGSSAREHRPAAFDVEGGGK